MSEQQPTSRQLDLTAYIDRLANWSVENSPHNVDTTMLPDQMLEQDIRQILTPLRTNLQFGDTLQPEQWASFKAVLQERVSQVLQANQERSYQPQDTLDRQSHEDLQNQLDEVIVLGDATLPKQE